MSSKVYNPYEHTTVMVDHPKCGVSRELGKLHWVDEAWRGPMGILLHVGNRVWVAGSYSHEGHPEVLRVGDGRNNGYDEVGNCILSIPAEWCSYLTCSEAESVEQMIYADDELLAYAR